MFVIMFSIAAAQIYIFKNMKAFRAKTRLAPVISGPSGKTVLTNEGGVTYIHPKINDHTMKMTFDTGAASISINKSAAERAGITKLTKGRTLPSDLPSVTYIKTMTEYLVTVEVGGYKETDKWINVLDGDLMKGMDGNFGASSISHLFDFVTQQGTTTLAPAGKARIPTNPAGTIKLSYDPKNRYSFVNARINGKPVQLLLDTAFAILGDVDLALNPTVAQQFGVSSSDNVTLEVGGSHKFKVRMKHISELPTTFGLVDPNVLSKEFDIVTHHGGVTLVPKGTASIIAAARRAKRATRVRIA